MTTAGENLETFKFDVAISFAGSERDLAERLATLVRDEYGFEVFYDGFEPYKLWGEDLPTKFDDVYRQQSRYCAIFVSSEYLTRNWTRHELRSAISRTIVERGDAYILPIQVDSVELPGLPTTIGYLSLETYSIEEVASYLAQKLESDADPEQIERFLKAVPTNPSAVKSVAMIYFRKSEDFDFYFRTLPKWSRRTTEEFVVRAPSASIKVIRSLASNLPDQFDFKYLDIASRWLGWSYRAASDQRLRSTAFWALVEIGMKFDEHDMGREIARIVSETKQPQELESIARVLIKHKGSKRWLSYYAHEKDVLKIQDAAEKIRTNSS